MSILSKLLGIEKPQPEIKPEPVVIPDPITDKVKVTELNGNIVEVDSWLKLDGDDVVMITSNSKKYHTHVSCFKNWKPEMRASFTGWTIIKKEDAIKNGMTYCSFCSENDDVTLDDLLDELESDEEL